MTTSYLSFMTLQTRKDVITVRAQVSNLFGSSGVARVILLGRGAKLWHTLRFYSFFNDKVYPMRISVKKSLIKVAIYEIYGMKWGAMAPWAPPRDAYDCISLYMMSIYKKLFSKNFSCSGSNVLRKTKAVLGSRLSKTFANSMQCFLVLYRLIRYRKIKKTITRLDRFLILWIIVD